MKFTIKKGYIVIDSGKPGPLYVAPHAAIAFSKPGDYQDKDTHYIAYRLAKDGGKAVVSSITRERDIDIGIDFFRNPPPLKMSMKYYEIIRKSPKKKSWIFRKKYAWTSKDEKDYSRKKKIYDNFWNEIGRFDGPIFFIHRQFLNPIRHPSIIDVVPFNYEKEVKDLVPHLNNDYQKIFRKIFPFYKKAFYFKTDCVLFKDKMEKVVNLKMFRGKKPRIHRRVKRFKSGVKRHPYVQITYMRNFTGASIKKHLRKKLFPTKHPIIEFEISEFLTERFPNIAIYIIKDIIEHLKLRDQS
jgi:hypothetical protein